MRTIGPIDWAIILWSSVDPGLLAGVVGPQAHGTHTTSFLVCSSTFSFVSILEFALHSISTDFKSYDHYSIIEMIFNKLHIEVF